MAYRFVLLFLVLLTLKAKGQVENSGMTDKFDSLESGKVTISGYVDAYYAVTQAGHINGDRVYAVSQSKDRQFGLNLGYIDIRYQDEYVRAKFTPAVGTYMNANYAAEPGTFKNIFEANGGLKIAKKRGIWLDAGILGSPFTYETPISKDQLLYTRSFAAEYIPYYLAGARLTLPLGKKFTSYLYVVNGFQQIEDVNNELAFAGQLEYKPNKNVLLNGNVYYGNEQSAANPTYRNRFVCDLYGIANLGPKWMLMADAYVGTQQIKDSLSQNNYLWWQANLALSYAFIKSWKIAGRLEYYSDPNTVMVSPVTPANGFEVFSGTLGLTYQASKNALLRLEARNYAGKEAVFIDKNQNQVSTDLMLITGLSVAF